MPICCTLSAHHEEFCPKSHKFTFEKEECGQKSEAGENEGIKIFNKQGSIN